MTAPTEVATLTPQALAAATIALCRPGTIRRRSTNEATGTVSLWLACGRFVRINRRSWAAGGGLWWMLGAAEGDLPADRFESVQTMVDVCESAAGA
ncbi:hypothetical protein ACFWPK_04175 [Nocardia sp. NPDC058519]|uniref:hypothetical protein n=1 Tax=Nocardia sp. NPDC058519 TaxID=3346535 RepID=UPI003667FA70